MYYDYETFVKMTENTFAHFLPESYKHMKVEVFSSKTTNIVQDAVRFKGGDEKVLLTPVISVKEMYEKYLDGQDIAELFKTTAKHMCENYEDGKAYFEAFNKENVKDKIIFRLINKEQNKELLKTTPHREILDCALIYCIAFEMDELNRVTGIIRTGMLDKLGLTENDLYELAYKNTRTIMPPDLQLMDDIIRKKTGDDSFTSPVGIIVFTNEYREYGAACMIYEDILHDIAECLNSNLIVVPSSVHETLLMLDPGGDLSLVSEMVHEVNMNDVSLEERLSNNVYRYNKDERKLYMATNSPYKRLDGKMLEDEKARKSLGKSFSR